MVESVDLGINAALSTVTTKWMLAGLRRRWNAVLLSLNDKAVRGRLLLSSPGRGRAVHPSKDKDPSGSLAGSPLVCPAAF